PHLKIPGLAQHLPFSEERPIVDISQEDTRCNPDLGSSSSSLLRGSSLDSDSFLTDNRTTHPVRASVRDWPRPGSCATQPETICSGFVAANTPKHGKKLIGYKGSNEMCGTRGHSAVLPNASKKPN